jgi:hypothetical protein
MIFRKGLCYSQLRDAGLQIDDAMAEQIRFSRERESMANWTWTNTWRLSQPVCHEQDALGAAISPASALVKLRTLANKTSAS